MPTLIFNATEIPPWVAGLKPDVIPPVETQTSGDTSAVSTQPLAAVPPQAEIEPESPQSDLRSRFDGRHPSEIKPGRPGKPCDDRAKMLLQAVDTARAEWRAAVAIEKEQIKLLKENTKMAHDLFIAAKERYENR